MDEPTKQTEGDRHLGNLILLSICAIIVGIGVWLAFALDDARKIDNCVAQGRRNCMPIDVPSR